MLFCPSSYYSIYTGQARGNSTPFPDHLPDCIKYKSRLVEGLEESHIRRSNDPTSCLNWLTPAVSHLCMGTPHPGLTERRKSGACRRGVVWHGRSLTQFISIQRPSFPLLFLFPLFPIPTPASPPHLPPYLTQTCHQTHLAFHGLSIQYHHCSIPNNHISFLHNNQCQTPYLPR